MTPSGDDAIRAYVSMLTGPRPQGFMELRYRLPEGGMGRRFYAADRTRSLVNNISRLGSRTDVYVGCIPRTYRAGSRDAVGFSRVFWADCDAPGAAAALVTVRPAPTMVVRSGGPGGARHAYWLLDRPVSPTVVEALNRSMVEHIGADPACCDPGRILRPPETRNHKYAPAAPVRLEIFEPGRAYGLDEVVALLPDVPMPAPVAPAVSHRAPGDPLLSIPPEQYVRQLLGRRVDRSRKVSCPFHSDVDPSLHAYMHADRGWFCFSCRRGGSIYDLAAPLWGLKTKGADFLELRHRLEIEFGLSRNEPDRSRAA